MRTNFLFYLSEQNQYINLKFSFQIHLIFRVMLFFFFFLNFSTPWYMRLAVAGWLACPSDSAGYASGSFTPGRFNQVGQAKEEGPDEACYCMSLVLNHFRVLIEQMTLDIYSRSCLVVK